MSHIMKQVDFNLFSYPLRVLDPYCSPSTFWPSAIVQLMHILYLEYARLLVVTHHLLAAPPSFPPEVVFPPAFRTYRSPCLVLEYWSSSCSWRTVPLHTRERDGLFFGIEPPFYKCAHNMSGILHSSSVNARKTWCLFRNLCGALIRCNESLSAYPLMTLPVRRPVIWPCFASIADTLQEESANKG